MKVTLTLQQQQQQPLQASFKLQQQYGLRVMLNLMMK